jgi:hypothetical protein
MKDNAKFLENGRQPQSFGKTEDNLKFKEDVLKLWIEESCHNLLRFANQN